MIFYRFDVKKVPRFSLWDELWIKNGSRFKCVIEYIKAWYKPQFIRIGSPDASAEG